MNEFIKVGIREAANFMKNTESALVVCHVSPDGDAVGSALALVRILHLMGKKAAVTAPSPIPHFLSFMTQGEDFEYKKNMEDSFESVITVDVASISQLGTLSHLADITDFMIDHHAFGEAFADNLIMPSVSAAGEIIAKIYQTLIEDGAVCRDGRISSYLYAAISSDTGSFKYSNTTPETLRIAAELTEDINNSNGMKTDEIARLLHDTMNENDIKLFSLVTGALKKYENGTVVGALLTSQKIRLAGLDESDLGGAVDITRKTEGALVAFVLKQNSQDPTSFKLSVRSNADIDVAQVCSVFGGGGHIRAAGATVKASSPGKALESVVNLLSTSVSNFCNSEATNEQK